jgi:uncharacterized membrane protein
MRRAAVILIDQIDAVTYTVGEEVTFLRWGNMKIQSIDKDPASNKITAIRVRDILLSFFSFLFIIIFLVSALALVASCLCLSLLFTFVFPFP